MNIYTVTSEFLGYGGGILKAVVAAEDEEAAAKIAKKYWIEHTCVFEGMPVYVDNEGPMEYGLLINDIVFDEE